MDLYFLKNAELRFRFPVTPRAVSVALPGRGRTASLIDATEVSQRDGLGLREVAFEALLPNRRYPFAVYTGGVFLPAAHFLGLIKRLKDEREPFIFTLGDRHSMTTSLESYTVFEDADYGGDLMVAVRRREVREAGLRVVDAVKGETAAARPAPQVPPPRTYTAVSGDTLWAIAKRFLGDGARWPEIHALNLDTVSNPNMIFAGQILLLP